MGLFRWKGEMGVSGFQEICELLSKPVYRFLLSLTRDDILAEELLQETFYRAFLHFDQFEGKSSLYTWLCQIGKNAWLKECRKRKLYECVPTEELRSVASESPSPEIQAIKNEEYKKIRRAILNLSEPYKNVFILHIYADIKLKDIAAFYGKSESWARVTFYRAKKQIVQEVGE